MSGKMLLIGCGGNGVNCVKNFINVTKAPGFAEIKPRFVDTSLSNIRNEKDIKFDENDVYILEGVDGSGKLRSQNASEIQKIIKPIIHKFGPEDLNVVVSSASGGSGSVLSSLIAKELIEQGYPTVVIMVGSEESKITIENTVKTLQSLDNISRKQLNKPLIVSYFHNGPDASRLQNDESVKQTITALAVLASKEIAELDNADITNFLDFSKVTSVENGLSLLYITSKEEEAAKVEYPISAASIFTEVGASTSLLTPEYSCSGYNTSGVTDLHYVITQADVKPLFTKLSKRLENFKELSSARVRTESLGGDADDSGLVL